MSGRERPLTSGEGVRGYTNLAECSFCMWRPAMRRNLR
jgi:hypothetical protein